MSDDKKESKPVKSAVEAPKVEAPKVEAPKASKKENKEVTLLTVLPRGGGMVVEADGKFYHITDADTKTVKFVRNTGSVPVKMLHKCYDWTEKIETMLPDRQTVIDNIHRSIMRAGCINPGEGNPSRMLNTAFHMYTLTHKSEEK